jgi:predicted ArsR family transcriptional regulator
MDPLLIFLGGFFLGGLAVYIVSAHGERQAMLRHLAGDQYPAAKRAVIRYLRTHGTLTVQQLERLMEINGVTALRFLDRMSQENLVKAQGHRGQRESFYTRV